MAYEMKEGSFTLFVNDRKRGETDADWSGSIKLADGLEYWFNAYENQAKTGKRYLAVKIGKPKQSGFTALGDDEMPKSDSDIPF
jgi:hypothetical protein